LVKESCHVGGVGFQRREGLGVKSANGARNLAAQGTTLHVPEQMWLADRAVFGR
jgi:hypothetical protein